MFHLPVFKQGDDLASALTAADTVSGGLLGDDALLEPDPFSEEE